METPLGKIKGYEDEKLFTFLGVPYAIPPIDDLRFESTEPITKYNETIDATYFKN